MHDSLNPMAGISPMTGMWLNCVFGGKGVGMVNMLVYIVVAVFLAGLMKAGYPSIWEKLRNPRDQSMIALLIHPALILGATGLFAATDWGRKATNNRPPHGFSEILYEFSSASANNGSGFEGWGILVRVRQQFHASARKCAVGYRHGHRDAAGRFVPVIAPLALAASMAAKSRRRSRPERFARIPLLLACFYWVPFC